MTSVNDPLSTSTATLLAIPKRLGALSPEEGLPQAGPARARAADGQALAFLERLERLRMPVCLYDTEGRRITLDTGNEWFPPAIASEEIDATSASFREHRDELLLISDATVSRGPTPAGIGWLAFHIDQKFMESALSQLGLPVSLTANEFRLVANLLSGRDLRQAATRTGASYETRRKQLQIIFHKLNVNSQAGLIRTISLSLIGYLISRMTETDTQEDPELVLLRHHYGDDVLVHTFALRNGRRLQVWEFGPKDGKPCLFFHQMLAPTVLAPDKIAALHEHGLRWISAPRFFWGADASDPQQILADYSDDLAEVVRTMFGHALPCVAANTGVAWAAFFAARHPDLAARLVFVGSPYPATVARKETAPSGLQHALANVLRRRPAALHFLVRTYSRLARSKTLAAMAMRHSYRDAGPDKATLEAMLRQGWMQDWIKIVGEYASTRVAADLAINQLDWVSTLAKFNGGIDFIHGDADHMSPPEYITGIAGDIQHANLMMKPDAGHLVIMGHFHELLAHVRSA